MADGFKVADAFVDVAVDGDRIGQDAADAVRRGVRSVSVQDSTIRLGVDRDAFGDDVSAGIRASSLRAAPEAERQGSIIGRHFSQGFSTLHEDLTKTSKHVSDFGDRAAGSFIRTASALATIPAAAQGLGAVVGVLGSMSGAIGLIPAAGAGAVIAISALKLGVQGFGDAIKNVGDPAKFAESIKELSPAAQESAKAVQGLHKEWQAMQKIVQNQLFEGLADDIKALGKNYIPVLAHGLGNVNAQLNAGAQRTAQFLNKTEQVKTVNGIFANVTTSVGDLSQALQPITQILLDIVAVGSEFLPGLTGGFGDAAQSAADFIRNARETGKLKEWISEGLSTIGELVQLFKNLFGIVKTVFQAFDTEGAGTLTMLVGLTGQVKDFLRSVEGQEALRSLAQALKVVAEVVGDVLRAGLQQLAPLVKAAAPGFADLARQVGDVLVNAIQTVGPMLVDLAGWISDNIDWLGPLAISLYAAAKAFGVANTAMELFNKTTKANPWVLIISTLILLVTFIITNWDTIKVYLQDAWNWIKDTANTIWTGIKDFFVGIWTAIRDFFVNTGNEMSAEASAKWSMIRDTAVAIWTSIRDFFVGIGTGIRDFFVGIWTGIRDFFVNTGNQLSAEASSRWTAIKNVAISIWNSIKEFFSSTWNSIKSTVSNAVQAVYDRVRNAFNDARNAVVNIFNDVVGFVGSIPGRIISALGNLGSLLLGAGRALITGLLNGIKQAAVDMFNFVSGIAGRIASLKGPLPYDKIVLVDNGKALMQGLLTGLQSGFGPVRSLVGTMAGELSEAMAGTLPSSFSVNGPGAVPGTGLPSMTPAVTHVEIGSLTLNVSGNLDPTNPVAWRQAIQNIRSGIRDVERSVA